MASEVDICNLALAHLGDAATVASINPPEGSAQAEHCQRFYPLARDLILDLHDWNFATRRATLAELDVDLWDWAYAYVMPADAVRVLAINADGAGADAETEPYRIETDTNDTRIIRTDVEDATCKYIALVTDTTRFPPLVTQALSRLLASYLAGPLIKGAEGAAESKRQLDIFGGVLKQAMEKDARQLARDITHSPTWIGGR